MYDGDTFEHKGYTFRVKIRPDDQTGAPWKENDGHGPVSDWTTRGKRPGERVLATDRRSHRFYDYAEAMLIARRDGWGVHGDTQRKGESARAYAARAVEKDYEYLRAWCAGEWHYVGVIVTLDGDKTESESLWGVEDSDPAYVRETAIDLAGEIMARIEVDNPDIQVSEN